MLKLLHLFYRWRNTSVARRKFYSIFSNKCRKNLMVEQMAGLLVCSYNNFFPMTVKLKMIDSLMC